MFNAALDVAAVDSYDVFGEPFFRDVCQPVGLDAVEEVGVVVGGAHFHHACLFSHAHRQHILGRGYRRRGDEFAYGVGSD